MESIQDIFDIHNHSLPGVDDGAKNVIVSLRMLGISYDEGVRSIILTPHYNEAFWTYSREQAENIFNNLKEKSAILYPELTLYLGNEVYYRESRQDYDGIMSMANGRYVLIEFSTNTEFRKMCEAVMHLIELEYIPILAHVERYSCLTENVERVDELISIGAYIQINAKSILGGNGKLIRKFAKKLLAWHQVHFVATDAHSDKERAPHLREACDYITRKYGVEYAEKIFYENPKCVVDNEDIEE